MTLAGVLREEFRGVEGAGVWHSGGWVYVELPSPVVEVKCEADVMQARASLADRRMTRELAWNAFESAADRAVLELEDTYLCFKGMGNKVPKGYEQVR